MNAPLARLSSMPVQHDADAANRRREPRFAALAEAIMHHSGGMRSRVLIADVSRHGCCIRSESHLPQQGAFVTIGLGQEPMQPGVIRWIRDDSAGMEFLRPIPSDRREWFTIMEHGY